jgi:hypothetical protein
MAAASPSLFCLLVLGLLAARSSADEVETSDLERDLIAESPSCEKDFQAGLLLSG